MTYFQRLMAALAGRGAEEETAGGGDPAVRSRIAALEMDCKDRDRSIESLRAEYGTLQSERDRVAASAGQENLDRLFKKLAGPLSNLAALADLSEAGQEIAVRDVITLFHNIEKELGRAGLERIGAAGQHIAFDTAIHQRMSGATVHNGVPVTVRIPGYRIGAKVLLKAMVSAKEESRD
jgi:molecular chaperone GrpE (heat shock protein)